MSSVVCPFCGEDDFDLLGLKFHLVRGWCETFEQLNDHPRCMVPDCPYYLKRIPNTCRCGADEPPHAALSSGKTEGDKG
jgi:uncharacterized Zn-finger protein